MNLERNDLELEALNRSLNDDAVLEAYKKPYDNYHISLVPKILGTSLVTIGNLIYGKKPSYLKFRAIEIIARVPYQSWASSAFTLLTVFFANEEKALHLSKVARYAEAAQANETMHVIVISQLAHSEKRAWFIRDTLAPMVFALFYFWMSYILYLISPRYSYQLNYVFENHAFEQYSIFIIENKEALLAKPIQSNFLNWYGRHPQNQYEFFRSIRNDEIVHRNTSVQDIK